MRAKLALLVPVLLALSGGAASAHHSRAMFDRTKTVTLAGVVKAFDWSNPHVYIEVIVPNGKGGEASWSVESTSPGVLRRQGWTFDILKPGDRVTVDVHPLIDGRLGGSLMSITKADGRVLREGPVAQAPALGLAQDRQRRGGRTC